MEHCFSTSFLRYHGRWIFTKNAKNLLLPVQIEKTEINILQKNWGGGRGGSIFTFKDKEKKTLFESH